MKRILIALMLIIVFNNLVFAEDIIPNQEIDLNENKAVIKVQKQPANAAGKQKAVVKNNWFCVVIQINGKIKDTDTANK